VKIRIVGLLVFNLAMFFAITKKHSDNLLATIVPVMALFVANMLLVFVFRLRPPPVDDSLGGVIAVFRLTRWVAYIPVVGGASGIVIGAIDRSWKMCFVGFITLLLGFVLVACFDYTRRLLGGSR
jgi:predicted ferric reductase